VKPIKVLITLEVLVEEKKEEEEETFLRKI
jgi:hypothetical protein